MSKEVHYIVADDEGSYGPEHIWAESREAAALRYIEMHGLEESYVILGVVPNSNVAYYENDWVEVEVTTTESVMQLRRQQ